MKARAQINQTPQIWPDVSFQEMKNIRGVYVCTKQSPKDPADRYRFISFGNGFVLLADPGKCEPADNKWEQVTGLQFRRVSETITLTISNS